MPRPQYISVSNPIWVAVKPGRDPRRVVGVAAVLAQEVAVVPRRGERVGRGPSSERMPAASGRPAIGGAAAAGGEQFGGPIDAVGRVAEQPAQLADGPLGPGLADRRGIGACPRRSSTSGTTIAGLNTPNAAAITSPGTCPSTLPRLAKYDGPSGSATPLASPGLGVEAERHVVGVALRREVHLADDRFERRSESAGQCVNGR